MEYSRWLFNKLARINGHNNNHNNACDGIDLTLRLGLSLPDCDQNPVHNLGQDHVIIPACMAPNHIVNLSFPGRNTQGMNQLGMVNQGALVQGQQGFNGTQYAWSSNQMASNIHHMNYANAFNQFSGPSLGFPSYNTSCYNNLAPTSCCRFHRHQLPAPSPVPTNNYMLLDVPPRTTAPRSHQQEFGSTTASSSRPVKQNKRGRRHQRGGNNNDPNKRCTNYNCNTNDTPTWRRGPLGPKTLCNACGIKFRKEEEKRKAREAGSKGQQSNPNA